MTTLASWAGIDARGLASLYLVSDSRFTDANTGSVLTNEGQKIYVCRKHPHLFGYCGWVNFPAQALRTVTSQIDSGGIFSSNDSIDVRQERIAASLEKSLKSVVATAKLPPTLSFKILHDAREGSGLVS